MNRVVFYPIAFILLLLTLFCFPPLSMAGDMGICVSSPNLWHLPRFGGWILNALLVFLSVVVMASANKKYNFIPEAEPVMTMALALLLTSNCLTSATLSASTLMLFANVLCLFIILSTYEEMNAAREFFIVGTLPAIGAMFQCSFVMLIPVFIGGGLLMKSFRLRELIAFIFGLAAPYWIALGLGLVATDAFRMPDILTVFHAVKVGEGLTMTLVTACIMGGLGLIFALYNSVRLFNRNSRLRCMHSTFNLMGFMSLMGLIFNFNNFPAYYGTLALWFAIESAMLLYLYNIRYIQALLVGLLALFLPFYFIEL